MTTKATNILFIAISTALYVGLLFTGWNHLSADESYVLSQKKMNEGNYSVAIQQANKSIKKNPYEPRYYYGRAKILLASTVKNEAERKQIKQRAYADMQKALFLNPKNLVTLRNLVPVYYFLVTDDLEGTGGSTNMDSTYVVVTKNYFNNVKRYSPNDAGLPTLVAKYEKKLGFTEMYNESVSMVQRLRPDILEWHPNFN